MYARDMAKVRKHGLASPDGLVDVITFALLTIQQPLQTVERQFADVAKRGAHSVYLFGAKRGGFVYACEHKAALYAAVTQAASAASPVAAIEALCAVPCLGMVKAAFVAQLLGLEVACLDRHNLARLGLREDAFRLPKKALPATRRAKIAAYVDACAASGGSRYWWDSWCTHVAGRRGSPLKTAAAVSAYHWQCMGIAA